VAELLDSYMMMMMMILWYYVVKLILSCNSIVLGFIYIASYFKIIADTVNGTDKDLFSTLVGILDH
jgi:hypothetical protein